MTTTHPWTAPDAEDAQRHRRLTAPDALANAATWYATQGIAVFPLRPGEKRPATRHGLHDATTDPDQIREWWTRTPQANIGVPTGNLFDVIDIDPPEGWRSWAALRHLDCPNDCYDPACTGGIPPTYGRVITARTGAHLYIRPTGDGNTTNLNDWPNVDYRGAGGYVVLPPSYSAEHGRHWLWSTPIDTQGLKGDR